MLRAGDVEQNPGPWTCPTCTRPLVQSNICNICTTCALCTRKLASRSVQCSKCTGWLHIKCTDFKTTSERNKAKYNSWIGKCCIPQRRTPSPQPPLPPPSPPPPAPQPPTHPADLQILQLNINGITSKLTELLSYMESHSIHVAAIQETKLSTKSKSLNTPNFTCVRQDRGTNNGGGLAFLIHHSIPFQQEPTPLSLQNDTHIESQTISIPSQNSPLFIRNVYIPPVTSCTDDYSPTIPGLFENLSDTALILGDLNAHHSLWHSNATEDQRGKQLVDEMADLPYGTLNEDQTTFSRGNSHTAPDVSIASTNLLQSTTWNVQPALSSDHNPIHISLSTDCKKIKSERKTYINFNKANWKDFEKYCEEKFSNETINDNVHKSEHIFRIN